MRSPVSLFWRVVTLNAAIFLVGVAAEESLNRDWGDLDVLAVFTAVMVMVISNAFLLRRLFAPLERLADRMKTADLLRGRQRVPVTGVGEIATLERAFNEMIERLEQERRDASAYALEAQEAERKRLARGLHDEVGQAMTAVLLQLKQLAADADPDQRAALAAAQEVVKQSLDDVRRLAKELRPELLDNVGLASALAHLATSVERRGPFRVRRQIERDLPALDPQVELVLYRVAQESLTNVARHGGASEATLSLTRDDGSVVLRVVDNGRGLDPSQPEGGGLRGIRERALIVGGAAAIKPGPEGGVEVRLEIPVPTEQGPSSDGLAQTRHLPDPAAPPRVLMGQEQ